MEAFWEITIILEDNYNHWEVQSNQSWTVAYFCWGLQVVMYLVLYN